MKTSKTLMLTLALALATGACSDGENPEPGTGEIPAQLLDVEGQAEDAFDKALAGDFVGVAATSKSMDRDWRVIRARLVIDGALPVDLDAMDTSIAALVATVSTDPTTVARAANAVSATMDELFALYHPTVPPAILALDYLGREVVLDARVAPASATAHLDTVQATWDQVKPAVVAAGGGADAARYDASIASLRADVETGDGVALEAHANEGLEIIDAIEGVFAP